MAIDVTEALWAESAAIADFIDELDDDSFDTASLCEGWRVRDVMSHMIIGHTTGALPMMAKVARFRFDVPAGSKALSIDYGSTHTAAEIRTAWRDVVAHRTARGIARMIPDKEGFVDHLIHHQDMRRPLGRPRSIDPAHLGFALDAATGIGGFLGAKGRMKGLAWRATDIDWAKGDGPEVAGSAEALLLAAGGRASVFPELTGEGVSVLRDRCAT